MEGLRIFLGLGISIKGSEQFLWLMCISCVSRCLGSVRLIRGSAAHELCLFEPPAGSKANSSLGLLCWRSEVRSSGHGAARSCSDLRVHGSAGPEAWILMRILILIRVLIPILRLGLQEAN